MDVFALIAILFLGGMALQRVPAFPRDSGMAFNMYVVYVALPAMVLRYVPTLPLSTKLLTPVLTPWLLLLASATAVIGLGRLLGWRREVVGALLMTATMGNTSFLGVPMVQAHFGLEYVAYALLYDQLGSFLILATYGAVIIAIYDQQDPNRDASGLPSVKAILKKILTFPPFIAMVVAFLLRGTLFPEWISSILVRLSDTLVPVVMLAVGFQFRFRLDASYRGPLAAGLLIKMVAAPLLTLGVVRFMGLSGAAVDIAIFEAGMPAMVTAGALSMAAGLAPRLVASLVGLGILLSFGSLILIKILILL
ncbi:MAG: AEC family transporter [Magnetococcales bacterium]|nr:AEC family transporter [Magnetococcales bacterium]